MLGEVAAPGRRKQRGWLWLWSVSAAVSRNPSAASLLRCVLENAEVAGDPSETFRAIEGCRPRVLWLRI